MKTPSERYPHITRTIADQLGSRTLAMLGARDLLYTERGLQFKLGKFRGVRTTHITIVLDDDDTYSMTFDCCPTVRAMCNGAKIKTLAELDGVMVDNLRDMIAHYTGLAVRL